MELNLFRKTLLNLKIDFSKTIIGKVGGQGFGNIYQLAPRDYIKFAKLDFKNGEVRGLINSLTNAKRAIDCQIDNTLEQFGITSDTLDKSSQNLISDVNIKNKNLPHKLKLVQALGLSPGGLVSKVRNLRNKVEHYYKIPSMDEVEEAIEIAELFILSIDSKTKLPDNNFYISSSNFEYKKYSTVIENILDDNYFESQILIQLSPSTRKIHVTITKDSFVNPTFYFTEKDSIYYYFIRLINQLEDEAECLEALSLILSHCDHPIPLKDIKIIEFY